MGESQVTGLLARRVRNGSIMLVAAIVVSAAIYLRHETLANTSFVTGWLLVATMLLLASYNLRKKLPMLPLGRSATWLQIHVYAGMLTLVIFLLHVGLSLPSGPLEIVLWLLTVLLLASGFVGLLLSRAVPTRLTDQGERLIYERLPLFRARLASEIEELVTRSLNETASGMISGYYSRRLVRYFSRPQNFWMHLLGSTGPVQKLVAELRSLDRYLTPEAREIRSSIENIILLKDKLDFQYAWQKVLKAWLFVHVPLTYGVLVLAAGHVVLAYAFALH